MSAPEQAEQVNYATTALTLLILLTRLSLWPWRRERLDASFILVVTSVLVVVARIVTNVYYLRFGNASDVIKHADYFNPDNLDGVRTGSILVLVARVLITAVLWLQVCILLLFYSRITYGINWVAVVVKATWATVAATFVAVVLVTFLECRPISLYWQVSPSPGYCLHAYAQLLTQAVSNVILDIMLIVIAWPIVNLRKRTVAEHVTLYTLFALGTFCIVVSIIRVVSVHSSGSSQVTRSLWASVQMMVSTFVANAPNIYGSVRAMRMKKSSAAHSAPAVPTYGLGGTARTNRGRRQRMDSWLKMEHSEYVALTTNSQSYIRPLPPATTFYDDQTAPAPYSHYRAVEEGLGAHGEGDKVELSAASLRIQSP